MNDTNRALETIFNAAKALPPDSRKAYLELACKDEPGLCDKVERLLGAAEGADSFFETKPVGLTELDGPGMSPTLQEGPGTLIGRYKLLQQIGEGGCGTVFMAEQEEPVRRRVALKVIKLGMDTKAVVARFEAERQALAMMDHPNIARVLDAGATDSGRPFFVMELVRGIPITRYCDENKLDTRARLDLFIRVCQAIQHAHQKGVIHRDIKPSNILVTLHDGTPVPKVIDFGIAKATEGRLTDATLFTAFEQFIGTPAYMSPEQAEMSGLDIDTRSDIYSLGVLLYELLTGKTPFDARELAQSGIDAIRKTIREKEPQRPSTRLSTMLGDALTTTASAHGTDGLRLLKLVRGDLDWIVMKCLEKDRTRRYETANGLAADLTRHLTNEPVVARPPSQLYRFQKAYRRNRLVFTAAACVLVAMVISMGGIWVAGQREGLARVHESIQRNLAEQRRVEAESARKASETERQRADAQARKAVDNQEHSRRLLYAADMNLAQQSVNQNDLRRARHLLDRHRPEPGQEDLRGWEWRHLWQQCRSDALVQLTKRPVRAMSVSFSPDGSQLAVGYHDGRTELWDVARRVLVKELNSTNGGSLARVAFSPRSNVLAATSGSGTLKLHDLTSGRETILSRGGNPFREIAFTPDGSRLVSFTFSTSEPAAVVFDPAHGAAVSTNITAGANFIAGIARVSSTRNRLYLSSSSQTRQLTMKCLEPGTGREFWTADLGTDHGVTAMALSPDEKFLVTATGFVDAPIGVWEAETGKLITRLEGHTGWVGELRFSRDGRWLASAAADQTIRLWETRQWSEVRVFRGHEDEVGTVDFTPDGRMLASGSKDGVVLLWDIATRQSQYGHRTLSPEIVGLAEYAPGLAIAMGVDKTGPRGFQLRLDDLSETPVAVGSDLSRPTTYLPPNLFAYYEQTNLLRVMEYREAGSEIFREVVGSNLVSNPSGPPYAALACAREQRLIGWGERSGVVHVASLDQPARRWQWASELRWPAPKAFSPDGKQLVLSGQEGEKALELREVETGKLILHSDFRIVTSGDIMDHKPPVRFADGGRRLVAARQRRGNVTQVAFWDLTRPEQPPVLFHERGPLTDLGVSPDGRWVAVCTQAGIAVVFEAASMTRRHELPGSMQAVFSVAFSPDSRCLATGAGGRDSIKLWQVETGQELLTLPSRKGLLMDLAFAEGGNTLLLGSFGRPDLWQMWRAPSWEVIHAAEANEPHSSDSKEAGKAQNQHP